LEVGECGSAEVQKGIDRGMRGCCESGLVEFLFIGIFFGLGSVSSARMLSVWVWAFSSTGFSFFSFSFGLGP